MSGLTEADVLQKLREEVSGTGGVRRYARALKVSPATVSLVLHRKRGFGPKLLKAMGLRQETRFFFRRPLSAREEPGR